MPKATLVPFLPMSSSIRFSRWLVGIIIVLAAFAGAAEMPADSRSAAPPPPGYFIAILAVLVNSEAQDDSVVALRDGNV